MSRSIRKGPHVDERLWHRVRDQKQTDDRTPLKTWSRASTVIPDFVGHTFAVHNGKTFIRVFVTEDMVGHKLGEFAASRTFRGHTGRKR
jgi:small subunit ribosomal protein S19